MSANSVIEFIGLSCSVWVYYDASKRMVPSECSNRLWRFFSKCPPLTIAIGVLAFWIFVFPVYLIYRRKTSLTNHRIFAAGVTIRSMKSLALFFLGTAYLFVL